MMYPITQNLIPGLPKIPYRKGASAYEGVVAHSTATPNATATAEKNYETGHWQDAFVHFFVDWTSIVQTADTDYLSWHAGHSANERFVGVELCETADPALFAESYARYTWLLAKILYDKRLGVTHNVTFFTHADTSALFRETDHSDPVGYLASHGVSIDKLVADVTTEYDKLAGPPIQSNVSKPVSKGMPDNWQSKVIGTLKVTYAGADGVDIHLGNSFDAPVTRVTHAGDGHAVFEQANGMYRISLDEWVTTNSNYVAYTPVQPKPAYPGHLIQLNSPDHANVKLIQQKLSIPADGIFGQQTKQAVMNFQTAHGLVADGVVGPSSWNAMF